MSKAKRVWDSKKRAVRQDKQQVWLVDWEKKVNTNHWFEDATWTDVVYDSSWKKAQEPLQTYDTRWEEINPGPTPPTPTGSVRINRELTPGVVRQSYGNDLYVNIEWFTTLDQVQVSFSSQDWSSYNMETQDDLIKISFTAFAVGYCTITVTDTATWDSDSINIWCVAFDYNIPPLYVGMAIGRGVQVLMPDWSSGSIEAWIEDTSIAVINNIAQPQDGNWWVISCQWVATGATYVHIRPEAYPELEVRLGFEVTDYVLLASISNLSTASAKVFDASYDFASFSYLPINASEPVGQIWCNKISWPQWGYLYPGSFDASSGTMTLSFGWWENAQVWDQWVFEIVNNNDPENNLEITLTKGEYIEEVTLSQDSVTVYEWQTISVPFTYSPLDGDMDSIYLAWLDGYVTHSLTQWQNQGEGVLNITWIDVLWMGITWNVAFYKQWYGEMIAEIYVEVLPITLPNNM